MANAASRAPASLVTQYGGQGTRFAGFRYPDAPTFPLNGGVVQAAYLRPGERAQMFIDGQFIRDEQHPQAALPTDSWTQILETQPVMVITRARLPLLFLRGDSLLCGRALGFRPPSAEVLPTSAAAPVTPIPPCSPIDCSATPPRTIYDPVGCNCVCPSCPPPRTQQDPISCNCSCPPTPVCAPPLVKNPLTCNCDCPLTAASCTPAQPIFDAAHCRCTCPYSAATCAPRPFNTPTCSCGCEPYPQCTGNYVDDPANCRCRCGLTASSCGPNETFNSSACACECNLQESDCAADENVNSSNCTCERDCSQPPAGGCPDGQTYQPGSCMCMSSGSNRCRTFIEVSCRCAGNPLQCPGGESTERWSGFEPNSCGGGPSCSDLCNGACDFPIGNRECSWDFRCDNNGSSCSVDGDCN